MSIYPRIQNKLDSLAQEKTLHTLDDSVNSFLPFVSTVNSCYTLLGPGQTFTGVGELNNSPDVGVFFENRPGWYFVY